MKRIAYKTESNEAHLLQLVRDMQVGEVLQISEPTRSLEQNALLWPLLDCYSKQKEWPVLINGNLRQEKLTTWDWKHILTGTFEGEIANANGHPVEGFYVAFFENDLIWFARTLLLKASPKGSACICGEPESKGITHRADAPCYVTEEASKPQDEREDFAALLKAAERIEPRGDWVDKDWAFEHFGSMAEAEFVALATPELVAKVCRVASQPSAASGRELPPVAWMTGDPNLLVRNQANTMFTVSRTQLYANDIPLYAALTGAAPADANVGGLQITDAMVEAYLNANNDYWNRVDDFPSHVKWRNGTPKEATRVSLEAALAVATAPEPSAPADKVDAERFRAAIALNDNAETLYAAVINNTPDADAIRKKFDAAIARMRSEDEKGGKL